MNNFTCENCGQVREKGWSDEEAKAESQSQWGDMPAEDLAMVCDECYEKMRRVTADELITLAEKLKDSYRTIVQWSAYQVAVEAVFKSANLAIDWTCLCSPRTGRPYKKRIMKKKLSRAGL